MRLAFVLLVAVVALASAGCSGCGEDSAAPPPPPPPQGQQPAPGTRNRLLTVPLRALPVLATDGGSTD